MNDVLLSGFGTAIAFFVATVALNAGLAFVLKKKQKNPFIDDKPPTLSLRGSYIQRLIGIEKVAPVVGYVGHRKQEGAKIYEDGWHIICVGPATRLTQIVQDGEPLWVGNINSTDHPSGYSAKVKGGGTFYIYWGEENQPVDTNLATRTSVNSRWPFHCYIYWKRKRINDDATWPSLEYVIGVEPASTQLTGFPIRQEGESVVNITTPFTVLRATLTDRGFISVVVVGLKAGELGFTGVQDRTAGSKEVFLQIKNLDVIPDGNYRPVIVREFATANETQIEFWDPIRLWDQRKSKTPPNGQLSLSLDFSNTEARAVAISENFGINPAVVIEDLLFSSYPRGLNEDRADYDLTALEDIGEELEGESVYISLLGDKGKEYNEMLARLMEDLQIILYFSDGLYRFKTLRTVRDQILSIGEKMVVSLPEVEQILDDNRDPDLIVYKYKDQFRNFREASVAISNDTNPDDVGFVRVEEPEIEIARDRDTAAKIGLIRSQVSFSGKSAIKFILNHEGSTLDPGTAIFLYSMNASLRVSTVLEFDNSTEVEVTAIEDYYSIPNPENQFDSIAGVGRTPQLVSDLAFDLIKAPVKISVPVKGKSSFIPLRIRSTEDIRTARFWLGLSSDRMFDLGANVPPVSGGKLKTSISPSTFSVLESGPTFEILGPDIGEVLSLETNEWEDGKQFAVINDEFFFLREIEQIDEGTYQLKGLIRERYGTKTQEHPVGSTVFIFNTDNCQCIDFLNVAPNVQYLLTSLPDIPGIETSLDNANFLFKTFEDHGFIPNAPVDLRTEHGINEFTPGNPTVFKWGYISNFDIFSGSGEQLAGLATDRVPQEGYFRVRILTINSATIKREDKVTEGSRWVYKTSDLKKDFGGYPNSFIFSVVYFIDNKPSRDVRIIVTNSE